MTIKKGRWGRLYLLGYKEVTLVVNPSISQPLVPNKLTYIIGTSFQVIAGYDECDPHSLWNDYTDFQFCLANSSLRVKTICIKLNLKNIHEVGYIL